VVDGIYAIGDVVPTPMLAHVAMDEGVVAAERIAGQASVMHYDAIPAVVFTHPEIASVGLKEQEARDKGHTLRVGRFPFRGIGRARARGDLDGWVKMIADADTGKLLGVHCIGAEAGHLIHEAVVAMAYGGYAEDLALTVHAHPTLSEAFKEAALAVDDRAIHI
jgi:dihydrolipoamide dehydrogenase